MNKNSKIYIAGHTGLVGSAIYRALVQDGYRNILFKNTSDLDLMDKSATEEFFLKENPDYVFLAAAKVGGILANSLYPADFFYKNIMIQTNVIHSAYLSGVKRLIFLGSSCIYPKSSPQPIKEDYLLLSSLEETNRAYAIAKISGLEMCRSYNSQFDTQFISAMPTNIYGINDTYDINNSHVIPALILKIHQAKISNSKEVFVWGTGNPKREFLFSEDLAEALILLMTISDDNYKTIKNGIINIGYGSDIKIIELVNILKKIIEYRGEVLFDTSKPDGVSQKLLDSTNILKMGWTPKTDIISGLKKTYESFLIEYKNKIHE